MESIAHVLGWLWTHKVWTAVGAVSAAMGIYEGIVAFANRRVDAKIFRSLTENGIMSSEELSGSTGIRLGKTVSRAWDLFRDEKIGHAKNFQGQDRWMPLSNQGQPRHRG